MVAARAKDPATSKQAARINPAALEGLRYEIYRTLARRPMRGFTDDELVDALETRRTPQRVRTARAELVKTALVVAAEGITRPTRYGNPAQVWLAR